MTLPQWMFHYRECIRFKKERNSTIKALLSAIEAFSTYSHPKMDLHKIFDSIEKRKLKENAAQFEEEATTAYEYAMSILPKTLSVVEEKKERETFLPQTNVPKRRNRKKKSDL